MAKRDRVQGIRQKPISAGAERTLQQALALHQLGRLAEAERLYKQILQQDPNHVDALHLLGMAALQAGQKERGVRLLEKVIRIRPDIASAHSNLGVALRDLGRFTDAIASYDKAIALTPESAEPHNNRGVALADLGRLDEALASYERAIALKPDYAEAHNNRGNALRELNRLEEALDSYDKAIALKPRSAEAHTNRGIALEELRRFDEALASHERAITLKPDYAEAHNNRGIALRDLNRLEEAVASYDRAIALEPHYAAAYSNRGLALRDLKRFGEAIASYDKAIALKPNYAEAYFNKSLCCLTMGNMALGWRLFEYRKKMARPMGYRPYARPAWLGGDDLTGKTLFLYWEQGLGDTIQFCRYAGLALSRDARVVMSVQDPLVRLLRGMEPQIKILGADQEPDLFDFHCPLMSLPLAFGTSWETIPSMPRYLAANPELKAQWAERLPPARRPRIGLSWSGNPIHPNDHNRSMTAELLHPLLCLDADWFCLQKEIRAQDAEALKKFPKITLLGERLEDFADTAAVIEAFDLVISVDTAVAHLAGALGKPVWLLLPFSTDWRWWPEREESAWYPSARLYRQPRIDDWPSVVARVKADLLAQFRGS
ncbi:MAG TPA: tetratricopeptide repeat protein [Acetobacteraceae bacterium]|nr:tetratricopeptide repeat protein [Acetobacteraceae bacterium]